MAAVRDQEGMLCTGAEHIGKALSTHWQSVMKSPNKGVADWPFTLGAAIPLGGGAPPAKTLAGAKEGHSAPGAGKLGPTVRARARWRPSSTVAAVPRTVLPSHAKTHCGHETLRDLLGEVVSGRHTVPAQGTSKPQGGKAAPHGQNGLR